MHGRSEHCSSGSTLSMCSCSMSHELRSGRAAVAALGATAGGPHVWLLPEGAGSPRDPAHPVHGQRMRRQRGERGRLRRQRRHRRQLRAVAPDEGGVQLGGRKGRVRGQAAQEGLVGRQAAHLQGRVQRSKCRRRRPNYALLSDVELAACPYLRARAQMCKDAPHVRPRQAPISRRVAVRTHIPAV